MQPQSSKINIFFFLVSLILFSWFLQPIKIKVGFFLSYLYWLLHHSVFKAFKHSSFDLYQQCKVTLYHDFSYRFFNQNIGIHDVWLTRVINVILLLVIFFFRSITWTIFQFICSSCLSVFSLLSQLCSFKTSH